MYDLRRSVLRLCQVIPFCCWRLARHVNENSEKLRSSFVTHEGKEDIEVVVGLGFTDEQWPEVLPVFESEVRK